MIGDNFNSEAWRTQGLLTDICMDWSEYLKQGGPTYCENIKGLLMDKFSLKTHGTLWVQGFYVPQSGPYEFFSTDQNFVYISTGPKS